MDGGRPAFSTRSRSALRFLAHHQPQCPGTERCSPAYVLKSIGWTISRVGLCPVLARRPDLARAIANFAEHCNPPRQAIPLARRTSWNFHTRVLMRGSARSVVRLLSISDCSSPGWAASNTRSVTSASWRDTLWPSADGAKDVALHSTH